MHVVHAISTLDPRSGGPPAALAGLASAQRRLGLDVTVVCTYVEGMDLRLAESLKKADVRVNLIGPTYSPLGLHSQLKPTLTKTIAEADVVHIHALWEDIQHQAARVARRQGKPYLMRPAGMLGTWSLQQSRLKKQLYLAIRLRRDLNQAAAIHYTANAERDEAAPLGLKAPTIVEPNGLDLGEFEHLPDPGTFRRTHPELGDRRFVLFLSRVHPKKGLDLLIPAMAKAGIPDVMFVIAGPGEESYIHHLHNLVGQCGLTDRVLFTGMLHGPTRIEAMVDADLFVLPSHQENFGIAVVEALAAGTPVLISDQVNIHADIVAGGVGEAVSLKVDAIAAGLRRWLTDPHRRHAASLIARSFVRDRYDWERIAERWRGHYTRLAGGSREYV